MEELDDEPGGRVDNESDRPFSCNPTVEELYNYIDGYLDDSQRAEFRSHLQRCNGCDDVYHFEVGLRSFIGSRVRQVMPPDARRRIMDSLENLF